MKTVYKYLMLAGLVFLAAACEKNIAIENSADDSAKKIITETVSADVYGETKATVSSDDGGFAWLKYKDKIAVHVNGTTPQYVNSGTPNTSYTTAAFSVSYPAGYARDAFAIFPNTLVAADAANYGQSGHSLDVTLPSSYTLEQVSGTGSGMLQYETAANIKAKAGTVTPCPMIATNNSGEGWMFYQLCGMLRLTVNSIPSDATGLVIQFPGKKVNGSFSIASPVMPGTSTIETGVPASGEDQITVTFAAGTTSATINLPLPTGDYDDVFITPVGSATKVAAVRHIKAGGYTAQAAHGKKLTTALVAFAGDGGKYYAFAPGNLQFQASTNTWRFAEHQYDFVGDNTRGTVSVDETKSNNNLISSSYTGWIDLFGWGTSGWSSGATAYLPYSTSGTNSDYYPGGSYTNNLTGDYAKADWGVNNAIGSYGANTWHTPTSLDWSTIATASNSGFAVINNGTTNIFGIVITPSSGWSDPSKTTHEGTDDQTFTTGATLTTWGTASSESSTASNYYTLENWNSMEDAGAIFLPRAGDRRVATTYVMTNYGMYWSSTAEDANYAYYLQFGINNSGDYRFNASNDEDRCLGLSVRLIREL